MNNGGMLVIGIILIVVGALVQSDLFSFLLDVIGWIVIIVGVIVGVIGLVGMIRGNNRSSF